MAIAGWAVALVQRGDWAGPQPGQAPLAVPNVTAHPSTASVPVTVLLCDGPLLCSFNVGIKGLTSLHLWNYFAGFCKDFLVDLLVALANKHRQNMERRCVLLVIKPSVCPRKYHKLEN